MTGVFLTCMASSTNGVLIDWTTTTTKNRLKSTQLVLAMETDVFIVVAVGYGASFTPEAVIVAMHLPTPRAAELDFASSVNASELAKQLPRTSVLQKGPVGND